ncbi:putative polysaccharide ABC transporter ATP-binding protein [Candidatus Promineifilum breve]|uniref:Polysaccharide ABC transporter ATP-binding protein n=1 Tax=Candidatus Promineifilum breve TaxID=1806508 RepID=A0A160T262_9CHLR|nr:ABC transporter ATP-binding protein [Candidatus Promineifilum breve]CUS04171.2 putative polysaccharide ABC transporter ATP-binding protein [Candidatus Promineifilum breve]
MKISTNGNRSRSAAIEVKGLSKQYHIGLPEQRSDSLLQSAFAWVGAPVANFRRLRRQGQLSADTAADVIWALRDVTFTVERGEVIGIIGRNGAGKSTLLKILSRITPPSTGRITLNGRVSSLLEVGTGFHPELTGRENVYLNGTILGMRKAEVDRKFDEIVAFAEVEKFIDTPVKRYSSGMRVRLAFAVSAHLESEILLVDEVLAVGDAAFQAKCLNKMDGVSQSGRTVLFVSHNMQVMAQLCRRLLLLDGGRLVAEGAPAAIIGRYLDDALVTTTLDPLQLGEEVRVNRLSVTQNGAPAGEFLDSGRPFEIHVNYEVLRSLRNLLLGFNVVTGDGTSLFRTYDMLAYGLGERAPGAYESVFQLPGGLLPAGHYFFEVVVGIHRLRWLSKGDIRLRLNLSGAREWDVDFPGVVSPVGNWTVLPNGHV